MPAPTVKERAIEAVLQLQGSASWEDVMEQILFVEQVERGLTDANAGRTIAHEQVKARYGL